MKNDEKKYEKVINTLKNLKKVKAPENFEADLKRRINSEEFSREEKKGFWQNIFVPAKLIPSIGLVVVAVVVFFVVETNSEEMENPFLIQPRVRQDIVEVKDFDDFAKKQKELEEVKSRETNKPEIQNRKEKSKSELSVDKKISGGEKGAEVDELSDKRVKDLGRDQGLHQEGMVVSDSVLTTAPEPKLTAASIDTTFPESAEQVITKQELNFRQIQLSPKEQKVVDELKNQVQNSERPAKYQK